MAVFLRIISLSFVALISDTICGGKALSYQSLSPFRNFWNCLPTIAMPVYPRILPYTDFQVWMPRYESIEFIVLQMVRSCQFLADSRETQLKSVNFLRPQQSRRSLKEGTPWSRPLWMLIASRSIRMCLNQGPTTNKFLTWSTNSPSLSLMIVLLAPLKNLSRLTVSSNSGLKYELSSLINSILSPYKLTTGKEETSSVCPNLQPAALNYTYIDGSIVQSQPLQSPMNCWQALGPSTMGRNQSQVIFWISPVTQFLAIVYIYQSFRFRMFRIIRSQIRLCSLIKSV